MATDIIYLVFLSSTFDDLREERTEVQKALLKLRCMPIGMELFGSAVEDTWDFIKRQIAESDYFVVIIADRYGTLASDGTSFTEKEYDYARELGKPVLAFIHADRGSIHRDKSDNDADKRSKLELFIQKVLKSPVSYFKSPHELAKEVLASFITTRDRWPAVGFVRADQVPNLKKYAELLEQKAALEAENATLKASTLSIFRHASDTIRLEAVAGRQQIIEKDGGVAEVSLTDPAEQKFSVEWSWGQLFVYIAEQMITGHDGYMLLQSLVLQSITGYTSGTHYERFTPEDQFRKLTLRMFGWGLIGFETKTHSRLPFHYEEQVLRLTEYGQKQYGLLMS